MYTILRGSFHDVMEPLADKTLALLIQLPPSLQIKEGLDALRELDFELEDTFRYAIEVRHPSWYSKYFPRNNRNCRD